MQNIAYVLLEAHLGLCLGGSPRFLQYAYASPVELSIRSPTRHRQIR